MSSLSDLFVSYKAVSLPSVSVPKYDTAVTPTVMIELGNLATKVSNVKTKMESSPVFSKWTSSGSLEKPYTKTTQTLSSEAAPTILGDTITVGGVQMPKSWVENKWKQECGSEFGVIDEKHRKGVVVKSNSGKADNKGGKKTYGPGLLYNPETGHSMQLDEPEGGYTTKELTRLFLVSLGKEVTRAKEAGCKTWYQIAAYGGIDGNFGSNSPVTKGLKQMILQGKSDLEIFNYIAHASDSQRSEFPGLIKRRMWEARTWIGDFDPNGSRSDTNKAKVQELNSGKSSYAKLGGILNRIKLMNL